MNGNKIGIPEQLSTTSEPPKQHCHINGCTESVDTEKAQIIISSTPGKSAMFCEKHRTEADEYFDSLDD